MRFIKESVIQASAEAVFAFHERPDALYRLQPPWQKAEILLPPASLEVGTRVRLRVKLGPFWQAIEAVHVEYEPGRMFADRMLKGPFKSWLHHHRVTARTDNSSVLTDDVAYELPFGVLGRLAGAALAKRELNRLFDYRHRITREACEPES